MERKTKDQEDDQKQLMEMLRKELEGKSRHPSKSTTVKS